MRVALWVRLHALWVFQEKCGDMGERNTENPKQRLQQHSCRWAKDWSTNSAVYPSLWH